MEENIFGITIEKKTNRYVYFTNDTKMTHSEYHKYSQGKRKEHGERFNKCKEISAKEHERNMDEELEAFEKRVSSISENPVNALRYIIMVNGDGEYKWVFAKKTVSHSFIRDEFIEKNDGEVAWWCAGGGFYAMQAGNALQNLTQKFLGLDNLMFRDNILYLFGTSDSYGLKKEHFILAMDYIPHVENIEVRIMFDNWEFTKFNVKK